MPEEKPIVYILHGDDPLAINRFVDGMAARLGDPATAELNITRLEGQQANDEEVRTAALAIPFLAERRLVILTQPLARLNSEAARDRFQAFLDGLPQSTALVLIVEDQWSRGRWSVLHESHWLLKWAHKAEKRALLRAFALPQPAEMPAWVRSYAKELGGQIEPAAAQALAESTGNDTHQASREVEKLLLYVDFQRPVTVEDVELLCAGGKQVGVFEMVDALALGNTAAALRLLQGLFDQQDAISLFGMVVRQFRLLIQMRELLDEGAPAAQAAKELNQPDFVIRKLTSQARRFSLEDLEAIYHRLLEMDLGFKSSQLTPELALETLIAGLQEMQPAQSSR